MLFLILKLIIITSIWVLGLTIATQEDMLLYSIRDRLTDSHGKAKRSIYDPLIICQWCMPSIHSLFGFLFAYKLGILIMPLPVGTLLVMYVLVLMGSSLTCGMIWQTYKLMEQAGKYFVNAEKLKYFEVMKKKEEYKNQLYGQTNKRR